MHVQASLEPLCIAERFGVPDPLFRGRMLETETSWEFRHVACRIRPCPPPPPPISLHKHGRSQGKRRSDGDPVLRQSGDGGFGPHASNNGGDLFAETRTRPDPDKQCGLGSVRLG